jgi:hypothetical protein
VSTLSTQLSWSHFIELLPIKDPLAREFYAEMCRIEHWDVRTLRQKIGGVLFQRTALSRKPETVISTEIARLRNGQRRRGRPGMIADLRPYAEYKEPGLPWLGQVPKADSCDGVARIDDGV